jgi:hypothetical protein
VEEEVDPPAAVEACEAAWIWSARDFYLKVRDAKLTDDPALEAFEAKLEAEASALEIAPLAEEPMEEAPEAADEALPEAC